MKKSNVAMRNLLIELPEDLMLRLARRAKDHEKTVHRLAQDYLLERLK